MLHEKEIRCVRTAFKPMSANVLTRPSRRATHAGRDDHQVRASTGQADGAMTHRRTQDMGSQQVRAWKLFLSRDRTVTPANGNWTNNTSLAKKQAPTTRSPPRLDPLTRGPLTNPTNAPFNSTNPLSKTETASHNMHVRSSYWVFHLIIRVFTEWILGVNFEPPDLPIGRPFRPKGGPFPFFGDAQGLAGTPCMFAKLATTRHVVFKPM